MKPITADNHDGRTLLALRAGPMTPGEISRRVGGSVSRWLLTEGLVSQDDSYYRITEAGRAACPYRNPLAAIVQPPIKTRMEIEPMTIKLTRPEVLAAITAAGPQGISKADLCIRFPEVTDEGINFHLMQLKKDGAAHNPRRGHWVATAVQTQPPRTVVQAAQSIKHHATREAVLAWLKSRPIGTASIPEAIAGAIGCDEDSTRAVLAGLYAGLKVDRVKTDNDWAYIIGTPKLETQHESHAEPEGSPTVNPENEPKTETRPEPPFAARLAYVQVTVKPEAVATQDQLDEPTNSTSISSELVNPPSPTQRMDATLQYDTIYGHDDPHFALWSDGTLVIVTDNNTIEIDPAAFKALRAYLGMFAEEA